MKNLYVSGILFCLMISLNCFSQNTKEIRLKSGNFTPQKNVNELSTHAHFTDKELVYNCYYRIIQFSGALTTQQKEELANKGISLLYYIPKNSFITKVEKNANLNLIKDYGALWVSKVETTFKLSKKLINKTYDDWALLGNNIKLNALAYEGLNHELIIAKAESIGATVIDINYMNVVELVVSLDHLKELYELPEFYYFEQIEAPEEPENLVGRTNHRSNFVATDYSTGLKYDGTGMKIMIQDDGVIGPHIDYEGRMTARTSGNFGDHGDHCAGTIMGAGNKDPKARGMAYGADIFVYNSNNNNYNQIPNIYTNEDIVITSKSYSDGNNAGYTSLARQLDQQVRNYPSLTHVFSAGNAGTSDFGYGAGAGWGNITGGHKQGKNVIAVGNLTANDGLNSSSSRGPAHDGRIKPDICAVGTSVYSTIDQNDYDFKTGTSMSCPGVAGSIAQLYDAYKSMNGGNNPNAALIKASVLNTADDLGNPGPDFKHGWGRINVRRAYNILSSNQYLSSSVTHGANNSHNITVPTGTRELRIMVLWTDYEASVNSSSTLVNDINMQVVDPNTTSYNPWVLNSAPNATILDMDAIRGIDDVNNMEQVTIDNPVAGNYSINISGNFIPQGPQEYYIVYEFVQNEVVVTYPIGGEGFNPGESQTIRWDSPDYNITSFFQLQYTTNNGASWNSISSGVPGTLRYYNWVVPNVLSGEVKVRVTQGANSDESDEVFSIIGTPTNLNVDWACPNALLLSWDPVPGATGYEVFVLGTKYMQDVGTVTVPEKSVPVPSNVTSWLSVRSLGPTNAVGERAIAIEKLPGVFNCTVGLDEQQELNQITVFPNPARNQLNISGLEKLSNVFVLNAVGQDVLSHNGVVGKLTLDLNELSSGVYFLKVVSEDQNFVTKFIKE